MERIARVIVHHGNRILALTALITLVAAAMLFRIQFNANIASFITKGNPTGETFAALQDKYETSDPINVLLSLPEDGDFRDRANLVALTEFRDRLSGLENVGSVAALVPTQSPLDGSQITPALVSVAPDFAIDALIGGPITDLLLSEDGRHTMIFVIPSAEETAVARVVRDLEPPPGMEIEVAGNPTIYGAIIDILSLFLLLIPPVVIILLLATFYASVGERKLTILSVVPALLGSIWTFGLIFGLGREVDVVTVIVPIFVLVMGSADGLHFVTHFQDVAGETEDAVERVVSTLREVGVPMILTTVSTAAGFLSLLAANVQPISQLGVFSAIGIGFAGIISFFSLPALMLKVGSTGRVRRHSRGTRVTRAIRWMVLRRWTAPAIVGVLVVFAAISIPQLTVDSDPLFMFTKDHEVRAAFDKTEELFGGATPLTGEFVFDQGDLAGSIERVNAASDGLEALPGVRTVFSAADLAGSLPPEALAGIFSGAQESPIGKIATDDGLRFLLLPAEFDTADLRGWLDYADQNDEIRVLTGLPVLWDEIARLVLRAQIWSVVSALLLVALMLGITYRKLRPTVVALVPIVLTLGTLLGFVAVAGIQLNMITAVASSIVIGVGIDYSIHFIAAIDYARPDGPGYVLRAIDRARRPITANAMGIAVAMTALWLSPLRTHHHISLIMWVSMTVAAISALVVIPALLPRDGVEIPASAPSAAGSE
ncbi:MAG: MMPL family transporter [Acidimicrobiia bacterium]|nr:MMPL family transporter [Acidimicrobiia bacterium]